MPPADVCRCLVLGVFSASACKWVGLSRRWPLAAKVLPVVCKKLLTKVLFLAIASELLLLFLYSFSLLGKSIANFKCTLNEIVESNINLLQIFW